MSTEQPEPVRSSGCVLCSYVSRACTLVSVDTRTVLAAMLILLMRNVLTSTVDIPTKCVRVIYKTNLSVSVRTVFIRSHLVKQSDPVVQNYGDFNDDNNTETQAACRACDHDKTPAARPGTGTGHNVTPVILISGAAQTGHDQSPSMMRQPCASKCLRAGAMRPVNSPS